MNKRILIGVVVLCALLSITVAATFGVFVVSEHSTGDDFASDNVEYYGMEIDGTGESAVVQIPAAEAGSTTTIPLEDDETFGGTVDEPIEIYPQTDMHEIKVTLFDQDETDEVELRDDNGNLIDVQAISNQQATLVGQMEGGETYELVSINHELGEDRVETRVTEQPESEDLKVEYAGEGTRLVSFETIEVVEKKPQTAEYIGEHSEVSTTSGFVNIPKFQNVDATGAWERYDNDEWVEYESFAIESTGEYTTSFDDDGPWRVVINAVANTGETSWDLAINSEGIEDELSEPTIELVAPDDGSKVTERDVDLEVNIEDEDLNHDRGPHDVRFYGNDELIDTKEIEENGTVSVDWSDPDIGENEWYVEVEDSWGNIKTSDTWVFNTPTELEIRDENTGLLLDDVESDVDVRFYPETDDEIVETRTTEDGVIDLEGLPNDEFVITISADGYYDRATFLSSIFEQQTAYVLNESEESVRIRFSLDDRTNDFPDDETRLRLSKAVDIDGNTSFQIIAGEYFGADGRQSIDIEQGERYRITVENKEGQSRSLGAFIATEDDSVELDIGRVDISPPEERGFVFRANVIDEDDDRSIKIRYVDRDERTDELRYRIVEQHNESNVLQDWQTYPDAQEHQDTVPLGDDDDTNWVVEYEIDRDGETITNTVPVGGVGPLDWPISGKWLSAFGIFSLVGIASLFGGSLSRTGAIVVVVAGFAVTTLGIMTIPYSVLLLAGVVAVSFKVAEQGHGGPWA